MKTKECDVKLKVRFLDLRKELGLTQEEMAAFLGIDRSEVSKLERGKTCPVWLIRAIKLDQAMGKIGRSARDLDIDC